MMVYVALALLAAAAVAALTAISRRDGRRLAMQKRHLLDGAARLVDHSSIRLAADGLPVLDGRLSDARRIRIELIADTLVCRRLPQLWLKLTLVEDMPHRPAIGALARPTGAEFYSLVHDLPEWLPPPAVGIPLLMRGDGGATAAEVERCAAVFQALFRNPTVKEAVILPRGIRLVRQAAEGDRGAHLLLRQARFTLDEVPVETIRTAIAEARLLSEALGETAIAGHAAPRGGVVVR